MEGCAMSGRAGYDLGQEIGKMLEYPFQTKMAKIVEKQDTFLVW